MKVIKKLLIFIMVLLVSLSSSPVNASSSVTWYDDTYEGTDGINAYIIKADVLVPSDALGVTIDLPYDENFTLDYTEVVYSYYTSSTYSNFKFYSGSSLEATVNIEDLKADFPNQFDGVLMAGEYQFNLSDLIDQYSISGDITKIEITILTTYFRDSAPASVTGGNANVETALLESISETIDELLTQYNADGRVTFSYYDYALDLGESDFAVSWESFNTFDDNYIAKTNITFSAPVDTLTMYIPDSRYHTDNAGGSYPAIVLYDGVVEVETIDLRLIGLKSYTDLVIIDIGELAGLYGFTYSDIDNVTLIIPQNYSATPSQYVSYLDDNTIAVADATLRMVYFMTDGEAINKAPFVNIPPTYDGYKIGYKFINWKLSDGSIYNYTFVTEDMLVNDILYLYGTYSGYYEVEYDPDELVADESTGISLLLAELNFDNSVGYTIIYLFIVLIAVFGLLKFNVNSMFIAITLLLITGLFMYLQWLPIIVSLVAIFAIIFIIYLSVGGE